MRAEYSKQDSTICAKIQWTGKWSQVATDCNVSLLCLSLSLSMSLPYNDSLLLFSAYYLQQCPRDEASLNACLRDSGNKLVHYLQKGIPELDIYEVSPDT